MTETGIFRLPIDRLGQLTHMQSEFSSHRHKSLAKKCQCERTLISECNKINYLIMFCVFKSNNVVIEFGKPYYYVFDHTLETFGWFLYF